MLSIREIYKSIQGETSRAGLPCAFVRLAACDLRCSYCDSEYAFTGGEAMDVEQVVERVRALGCRLVTVTGGEPLLQGDVLPLVTRLLDSGHDVLVETSGAHDISGIDRRAVVVMDLKCPSSGEERENRWENLGALKSADEVKFVIASREDYDWAARVIRERDLPSRCGVLITWASPPPESAALNPFPEDHHRIDAGELAELILADGMEVRYLPQLHKVIWGETARSR